MESGATHGRRVRDEEGEGSRAPLLALTKLLDRIVTRIRMASEQEKEEEVSGEWRRTRY